MSLNTLRARHDLSGSALALREGWLVEQLLAQVWELLGYLEAGQPLAAEVRITLADLTALAQEAGVSAPAPVKTLPWLLRGEQLLFGQWQLVMDG